MSAIELKVVEKVYGQRTITLSLEKDKKTKKELFQSIQKVSL
jgi:hypothetical protein